MSALLATALADQLDEIRLYTREQVIELTGNACSEWWLDEMCRDGRIDCVIVGRQRRFTKEQVLKIYRVCTVPATAKPPKKR